MTTNIEKVGPIFLKMRLSEENGWIERQGIINLLDKSYLSVKVTSLSNTHIDFVEIQ
jgi:hypothetical protein